MFSKQTSELLRIILYYYECVCTSNIVSSPGQATQRLILVDTYPLPLLCTLDELHYYNIRLNPFNYSNVRLPSLHTTQPTDIPSGFMKELGVLNRIRIYLPHL